MINERDVSVMSIDFKNNTYILDGAMGTMFQKEGMKEGEDSTKFAYENPEIVKKIQRAYVSAGAQIIYAPTFNLNREKANNLGENLPNLIEKLAKPTIDVREEALGSGCEVYAALDMGPTGNMIEPMGDMTFEEAYNLYKEMAIAGEQIGCDVAVIETMTNLYETKAALLAVKENTNLPVMVSMSFEENGRTFTGTDIESMVLTLGGMGADALGINCSLGPIQILPMIEKMMSLTDIPVFAKPNAGLPDPATGGYDINSDEFAKAMSGYFGAGVCAAGGCCGTTPEYIEKMISYMPEDRDKIRDKREKVMRICSGDKVVAADHVAVIGERINPTGKKKMKNALKEGDLEYIQKQAISQVEAGAEILDVNVGVPGLDEATVMPQVVKKIQEVTDVPLQIDSSNAEAIEGALRVYNGKALVNSVNGDDEVMEKILPVVKKYGAAVIALTLDGRGIPETCQERFEIAEKILAKAIEYGIPREDVVADCLTLTASAQQREVDETLKTVRRVRDELGLATALGVSNVSFGLPQRSVINRTFLSMALENGLTLPIINPNDEDMMASVFAFNVLKNRDVGAVEYIARYPAEEKVSTVKASSGEKCSESLVSKNIRQGLEGETASSVRELLKVKKPMDIVNEDLITALDKVGKAFEKGEVFLPEMLKSAEAAQAGFQVIKEALDAEGGERKSRGTVVLATVKGDIHDIGKNIVKVIMENYGFNIVDLGRDVPVQTVVDAVRDTGAKALGLSALMTTTLPSMKETIAAVKGEFPECKIMVGGAVLTEEYAKEICADFYCEDAMKSVEAGQEVYEK